MATKRKSIWDTITERASQVYDQINPLDNGLTYQQRTPTSSKSAFSQVGQVGGQSARALIGNTARFANTANLGAREVADTARMMVANLTNNPLAFKNANESAQNNYNRFTTQGGILNAGTFFRSPEEAARGDFNTVARRIGGGTLGTAAEVVPFARGATLARAGGPVLPNVVRGGVEGALYGAAGGLGNEVANSGGGQNVNIRNILKSAAAGAALGGAAPVAVAGAQGVGRAGVNAVNDYRALTPEQRQTGAVGPNAKNAARAEDVPAAITTTSKPKVRTAAGEKINTGRMDISDPAAIRTQQLVDDLQTDIQGKVGGKLTLKEVSDRADTSSKTYRTGKNREQTIDAISRLKNSRDRVAQLQEKSAKGQSLSAAEQQELIQQTVNVVTRQADIARQLGSLRAKASPQDKQLIDVVIENLSRKGFEARDLLEKAKQFDLNDPKQLTQFYRTFHQASAEDWLDRLRYSSMLSSPITHIRNLSANIVGGGIIAPARKVVEGAIDVPRGLTKGGRTKYAGEAPAYSAGYVASFPDAVKAFGDTFTGKRLSINPDMDLAATLPLANKGVAGVADKILGSIGRLMEAADQAGIELVRGGERRALQYRERRGVKVKDLEGTAQTAADYQLFRGELGNKEQGTVLQALDWFPRKVLEARKSENALLRTTAKLTFPFVKTPTNIAKQMVEYSPLGLMTTIGAADKQAQISKAVLGTMVTGTAAATLAANDRLTFGTPSDKKQKERFLSEGKQPYSIKIGNKWISYQYLHPAVSFQLAAVASVKNKLDSGKIDDPTAEKILAGLAGTTQFFVDQSYFKNAQDFLNNVQGEALNSPVSATASALANTTSQFIPFRALATWIDNMTDQTQRVVDYQEDFLNQFGQNLSRQLPVLSENLNPRTDVVGDPIQKQHPAINAFSPAKVSTDTGGSVKDIFGPEGDDAVKQKAFKDAGFDTKEGKRFLQMSAEEQRKAALKDPAMRALYDKKQEVELRTRDDLLLPEGMSPSSAATLNEYNRLSDVEKERLYADDPAAEYRYARATYERDKLLGKFTKVEQKAKEESLKKAEVGSVYQQDTRDLYSRSQDDLAEWFNENPDQEQINELLRYDQALLDAGVIKKSKFEKWLPGEAKEEKGKGGDKKTDGKISMPNASFGSAKAVPAPKVKISGGGRKVAVRKRSRGKTASATLKIKRG